jgi:hypothetical protein
MTHIQLTQLITLTQTPGAQTFTRVERLFLPASLLQAPPSTIQTLDAWEIDLLHHTEMSVDLFHLQLIVCHPRCPTSTAMIKPAVGKHFTTKL